MVYKIQTSNQPVDDKGEPVDGLVEVDDAEFIDLARLGLIVPDKGDVDKEGRLKKAVAKDAPDAVIQTFPTGPIRTLPTDPAA